MSTLDNNNSSNPAILPPSPTGKFQLPDTLVIIFFVALLAMALTYVVPIGSFSTQEVQYVSDGVEKTRTVVDPNSFNYQLDELGQAVIEPVGLFAGGGGIGF